MPALDAGIHPCRRTMDRRATPGDDNWGWVIVNKIRYYGSGFGESLSVRR